jgi:hypothetical protein
MGDFFKLSSLFHHIHAAGDYCHTQVQILGGEDLELFVDLIG